MLFFILFERYVFIVVLIGFLGDVVLFFIFVIGYCKGMFVSLINKLFGR